VVADMFLAADGRWLEPASSSHFIPDLDPNDVQAIERDMPL
jgi:hypothetical protein